ncbi:unnamed protein product [Candida verbasci]|uniref:Protein PBN1 n=1 Tax=Candida verbasci TaxID=1227364 RepID=A0A9W4XIY7_9ASCO|nr:unnamed protein product [Candida verbasci]
MRQRITIYNPNSNNNDIIKKLDKKNLELALNEGQLPFIIENKYTIPNPSLKLDKIAKFRIHSVFNNIPNPLFPFNQAHGISIYMSPTKLSSQADIDEFYTESNLLIEELLGIKTTSKNWINSVNSIFYYDSTPKDLKFNYKLFGNVPSSSNSNFDLLFDGEKLTLRQLFNSIDLQFNKDSSDYKEIGVFAIDESISDTKDDLVLNGFRVIFDPLSDETENEGMLHKTMFHIKPRHRYLNKSIESTIKPNGLHPILSTKLQESKIIESDIKECKLYYYINLNKSLIFDPFQSIPQGANLTLNNGEKNLELPEYKINNWGNEILFEFENYNKTEIDFTLHSRYQLPNNETTSTEVFQSHPKVFIGCNVDEFELLSKSPFDTKGSIGGNYENYFTNDTVFYHFEKSSSDNLKIDIPHGTSNFENVNFITTVSIIFGIVIIVIPIFKKLFNTPRTTVAKKNE